MPIMSRIRHRRARAAAYWLALGSVTLVFGPLPVHSATLGWSAAFWLVLAPLLVLVLALSAPRAPVQIWRRLRHRAPRRPLWSA